MIFVPSIGRCCWLDDWMNEWMNEIIHSSSTAYFSAWLGVCFSQSQLSSGEGALIEGGVHCGQFNSPLKGPHINKQTFTPTVNWKQWCPMSRSGSTSHFFLLFLYTISIVFNCSSFCVPLFFWVFILLIFALSSSLCTVGWHGWFHLHISFLLLLKGITTVLCTIPSSFSY